MWNSVAGSVSLCHRQHRAGPEREFWYVNCNRLDIVRCGLPVWFCFPADSS